MKNLESKDDKKVSAALDMADKNGTIQWVEPLLEAFSTREDDELKESYEQSKRNRAERINDDE